MWDDFEVSKIELFEKFTKKHGGYLLSNQYLHFYELVYKDMHISYHIGDRNQFAYFYIARTCKCEIPMSLKARSFSIGESLGFQLENHKYKDYAIMAKDTDLAKIQMILNDPNVKKYDQLLEKYPITIEDHTMMVYRKFKLYVSTLTLDTLEQAVKMFEEMYEIIEYYTTQF